MRPKLEFISPDLIEQILDEAFQILRSPGVKVKDSSVREMLAGAGANIDTGSDVVKIPEELGRWALDQAPSEFYLYDREGEPAVQYGGDAVHFNPGSSGVNILDPLTKEHHPANTGDLVRLIKVAEGLDQYDAQSTAVICHDVPEELGDVYRLYLVLLHSKFQNHIENQPSLEKDHHDEDQVLASH